MKQHVIKEVNRIFNCDIHSKVRNNKNVNGRVAFTMYMKMYSGLGFGVIGRLFNKKHAMVYRYIENHRHWYKYDSNYRKLFDDLVNLNPIKFCNHVVFTCRTYRKSTNSEKIRLNQSKKLKK